MSAIIVDVGRDFSRFPSGRTPKDSKYSGELFREKFLKGPLAKNQTVKVLLDSALGYGSSFLEEAFGGLVRVYLFDKEFIRNHIILDSYDPEMIEEIWSYVELAA